MEIFLKIMSKILNIFFVILGVIFSIIIAGAIYFYITDPFNLRPIVEPFLFGDSKISSDINNKNKTGGQEKNNISEEKTFDFGGAPIEITPELQTCVFEKLGAERIKEFTAGSGPTLADILKIKSCLSK